MASTRPPRQRSGFLAWLRAHLLFDVPIQRKLVVFCGAVGGWFVAMGALGAASASDARLRTVILALTALSLVPLVAFGVLLTRSLRRPIVALTHRIRALAEGDATPGIEGATRSTAHDEVGELAARVDDLYLSFQRIAAFKAVIEEDESADDVYHRLGAEFEALGLDRYALLEISNSKNRLRLAASSADFPEGCCAPEIRLDASLCRAKRTGAIVSSIAFPGICKSYRAQGAAHVCVPVMVGGATGGVAAFLLDAPPPADAAARIAKAHRFIRESAGVLEAKRLTDSLKQAMLRDPMTGLYNRRFLEEYTESLVASAHRRATAVGVLMCDLDHFKQVNDTHGHDIGDAVLREVASVLVKAARASDLVVRFGGEEFLVVLQDSAVESATVVAERIRRAIEATRISTAHGVLRKTMSIGVAEFPKDAEGFWSVVKLADLALYRAKAAGRNRWVRWAPDGTDELAPASTDTPSVPDEPAAPAA
jgi:diguanylate cyclase (GGDEF)-like protein